MLKTEIGYRHRLVREQLGLSVPDYAGIMGVRPSTIYSWESGRTAVPHKILTVLEQKYGIPASWILTGIVSQAHQTTIPTLTHLTEQLQKLQAMVTGLRSTSPQVIPSPEIPQPYKIPMLMLGVSAGVPVAAEDTVEQEIDLAEMLLHNPGSTYFIRVVGDSMVNAGIADGDTLIVDCSVQPRYGQIVIARIFGELTVKRYIQQPDGSPILRAENPAYNDIIITADMEFAIIGVVRSCIKQF
ncbi:MAG: helix-turn-helix domain-containing protein [Chlorobi bacterium]|nr:MAG: translesion error-prone DNA polymerase V autoproteolytic subunit [Bacteroidota bacterium]KXK33762.1 MAG: repressor protein LexA [Chlorobi bacterium OLB6]MBL1160648.1 helix-turn-helix domain-containing protein [Chlorobiota bacterium]MBW7852998.1 translesion error-prone DNA polymerase V autoproteolytic subunit [Candidatus Kapabacteria bacterium]MCC6330762.1 translesion error-prone DNA polymerase V autoproteolytic subunit [Ignavibacteria bacterium]